MEIVRRKLNGDNPAGKEKNPFIEGTEINVAFLDIVTTEMYNGHSKKFYYEAMTKLAKGDKNHDIRAQVGSTCKDTTEQVKCLINMATDKSVLGIMWIGWAPFL